MAGVMEGGEWYRELTWGDDWPDEPQTTLQDERDDEPARDFTRADLEDNEEEEHERDDDD